MQRMKIELLKTTEKVSVYDLFIEYTYITLAAFTVTLKWYTVFDVVQSSPLSSPPCKFGKILVVDKFVEKNYIENFRIRNYFKKDFLNFSFHYVRYCNHLVTFLEKIYHQFFFKLSMKLIRAISSSSSVKSDHLSQ